MLPTTTNQFLNFYICIICYIYPLPLSPAPPLPPHKLPNDPQMVWHIRKHRHSANFANGRQRYRIFRSKYNESARDHQTGDHHATTIGPGLLTWSYGPGELLSYTRQVACQLLLKLLSLSLFLSVPICEILKLHSQFI